ncbi:hypothetical protein F4677DRAFT_438445 [Hypoxylon crocopeplum]|nr:hypothetical protein F4677DRAFT_438445 [Hypoxylon crocopeplum]
MASHQENSRFKPLMKEVKPDITCIDQHWFRINYDVPEDITNRLYELLSRDEKVKYEDIPNELKAYEVSDKSEKGETEPAERPRGINASIDGHQFRINPDAPQRIFGLFGELMRREKPRYEDVPDELKEYEVGNDAPEHGGD